jgi:hypothetical protein
VCLSQEAGGCLGSPLNLQESLLEFSQLQDRIKKEQELLLDSRLSIDIQAFGSNNAYAEAATTAAPPRQLFATAAPAAAAAVFESSGSSNMRGLKLSAAQLTTAPPSSTVVSRISPPPPPPPNFNGGFKQPASRMVQTPLPAYTQLRTPDSSSLIIDSSSSSPFSIKLEPGTTTDKLREATAAAAAPARSSNNNECSSSNSSGHAILKQFLQDTSFQSKFNLKPFDLGGGLSGFVTAGGAGGEKSAGLEENSSAAAASGLLEVKIEPVLDLAVQQVQKDIDTTCEMLSISKGTSTCGSCIDQIAIKDTKT